MIEGRAAEREARVGSKEEETSNERKYDERKLRRVTKERMSGQEMKGKKNESCQGGRCNNDGGDWKMEKAGSR